MSKNDHVETKTIETTHVERHATGVIPTGTSNTTTSQHSGFVLGVKKAVVAHHEFVVKINNANAASAKMQNVLANRNIVISSDTSM